MFAIAQTLLRPTNNLDLEKDLVKLGDFWYESFGIQRSA